MKNRLTLYHGSESCVKLPSLSGGRAFKDFGQGFYCTEYVDSAKEWSCNEKRNGIVNKYSLMTAELNILDLNSDGYCILHWLSLLLSNRKFTADTSIGSHAKDYILNNFPVNTDGVDIIVGHCADASFYTYALDLLQNNASFELVTSVLKNDIRGTQVVICSEKALSALKFKSSEETRQDICYPLRKKRDSLIRAAYLAERKADAKNAGRLYMIDVLRGGISANDPRLQ